MTDDTPSTGKPPWKSKTMWLGGLTTLVAVASFMQEHEMIMEHPQIAAWIGLGVGVLTIVIRKLTKGPIGLQGG
jgi:hypothetical protein